MGDTQKVTDIEYLRDTFEIGYNAFEDSRKEAAIVWDMYHNRQYTNDQLAILTNRGQPAETFNVIKMFARLLLGYYGTVINTVKANPVAIEDVITASVLNDTISSIMRTNSFEAEGEKVKLSGILAGLMCAHIRVVPTGEKDEFGRALYKLNIEHVPDNEIVLDPMSRKDDYSGARYIHRFRWIHEERVAELFGDEALTKLVQYYNFTNKNDAEYMVNHKDQEVGLFKIHNNYLIVHSIVVDAEGRSWSIFWSNGVILKTTEITHREVKFPYRVLKVHTSNSPEYYGIFREIIETQKAMNQALIKLQLLVNTQKAFVETGAVDSIESFTNAFNRVTAVIPVTNLKGIKIQDLSREALEQYQIIDKALNRIQRVLGVNDSFLGMAFASDSGRKVKLQQNASLVSLHYLTGRISAFYRFLGWDIANLIKQYYTAHQVVRIADDMSGERWLELNKPMEVFTGRMDAQGQPIMQIQYEEYLDPATGKPSIDENGNRVMVPIPLKETEVAFSKVDIEITANNFNDEDEKNQLMLEQVLAGAVGQLLAQVNPAGFFKAASLSMKSMKTKNSPEISAILEQTSTMLQQNPGAQQQASGMAQNMPGQLAQQGDSLSGAKSTTLNLPVNTNQAAV